MRKNYVEITGVDTSRIITLTEEEKRGLLSRSKAGDLQAREQLILGNLRLVLSVISKLSSKSESANDLFQVGCIGLIKAIDNFNLSLDVRFSTYAVPMIIGEVRRYLRDTGSMRVSRSVRDLAYRALKVKEDISLREQREPTLSELARILGESEQLVGEAIEAVAAPVSLYDSVYNDAGDDSAYIIDKLTENNNPSEELVESILLKDALKKLNEKEMNIITRRFFKGRTQMEIADEIGISQAQVSRLEKQAIEKLRRYMK